MAITALPPHVHQYSRLTVPPTPEDAATAKPDTLARQEQLRQKFIRETEAALASPNRTAWQRKPVAPADHDSGS